MGSREKLARWLKTQAADVSAALQSGAPASASANAQAWCIIEQVPAWHLALTSPSPSTWQCALTWVTVQVTPLHADPAPGVTEAIRGRGAHARHDAQRQQTGTCAVCKRHQKTSVLRAAWIFLKRATERIFLKCLWRGLHCGALATPEYFSRYLNFVLYQILSRGHIVCFVCVFPPCVCPLTPVLSWGVRNRQRPEQQSQVSDQWRVKWIRGTTHSLPSCFTPPPAHTHPWVFKNRNGVKESP